MKTMQVTVEIEVPEGAKWMAQDQNGEWFFYSERPAPIDGMWVAGDGEMRFAYPDKRPGKDWKNQLFEVY